MSVTPLFRFSDKKKRLNENRLWLSMDEPECNEEARVFANICAVDESLRDKWEILRHSLEMGEKLVWSDPDPSLRASILEKAYAAVMQTQTASQKSETTGASLFRLPGWGWIWVALFLVLSGGVCEQFRNANDNALRLEPVDMEILSLQREINQLRMDIIIEFDFDPDENA
ncbi:MAG: hypothetical protein AB1656_03570 [Candidatus Omnitrophota bacterium]